MTFHPSTHPGGQAFSVCSSPFSRLRGEASDEITSTHRRVVFFSTPSDLVSPHLGIFQRLHASRRRLIWVSSRTHAIPRFQPRGYSALRSGQDIPWIFVSIFDWNHGFSLHLCSLRVYDPISLFLVHSRQDMDWNFLLSIS